MRSLIALSAIGIGHNDQTSECEECSGTLLQTHPVRVELDLSEYGGNLVDTPDSKPGASRRGSSNLPTRTSTMDQIILDYLMSTDS